MKRRWVLLSKLRYLLEARRAEPEFDDEIDAHLGMLTQRFLAHGMTQEELGAQPVASSEILPS